MLYSASTVPARPVDYTTVSFRFGKVVEHLHEMRFPVAGNTLTVIVEDTDSIQGVDLSYCRSRIVWLDIPADKQRRGVALWYELLKPEHLPQKMYTDSSKGLFMYDPITKKGQHFHE